MKSSPGGPIGYRRDLRGSALATGALAVALALAPGCSAPAPSPELEAPATFIGRGACARCHSKEAAAWSGSQHDLAMQTADASTVLGDFDDATFTYGDVTSTFFRRDGKYWVRTDGPDGKLADYPIDYTFGVYPLQQYLIPFPGGRFQALGIAWDARPAEQGGQRWFHLYPGQSIGHDDPLHWTGPNQNCNYMCAECHSTHLQKNYDADTDSYDTTWSEIDVSCEACHGPGSRHEAWARAAANGPPPDVPHKGLVFALLPRDNGSWRFDGDQPTARRSVPRSLRNEVETCARCHSRRTWIHGDYRFGKPLADTHRISLLDAGLYYADGQILDEVYVYGSFLQSPMYREGVTCTDCHDPHTARLRDEGNALCTRCHMGRVFDTPEHHRHEVGQAGSRCVDCHMPTRTYMVVDPRRDHSFRVPRPDLSVKLGTPNACNACHTDRSATWAAETVLRWYPEGRSGKPSWAEAISAGRNVSASAPRALRDVVDDRETPGIVRATALMLLERWLGPHPEELLSRAVHDPDPLVRGAAATVLEVVEPKTRVKLGDPLLDDPVRTVRMEAGRVLGAVLSAVPEDRRPAAERALDEYREAQHFNADRAESYLNLGLLWLDRESPDLDRAAAEFETSLARMPSVAADVNLADVRREQGRDDDAEKLLRAAVALSPNEGAPHYALAMTLFRLGRAPDGLAELRRATELSPDEPRYVYAYGVALHDQGDMDGALAVLERAHRRFTGDRDILVALATFNRDAGNAEAAAAWRKKLAALD